MVAKLAHANPMTVLRTIVNQVIQLIIHQIGSVDADPELKDVIGYFNVQIEAYRDMITPVVDAFKYLTQVISSKFLSTF